MEEKTAYTDFLELLFSEQSYQRNQESGFKPFMQLYLKRGKTDRLKSYEFFFHASEGIFVRTSQMKKETRSCLVILTLRLFVASMEKRTKELAGEIKKKEDSTIAAKISNITSTINLANLREKSREKIFIRMIVTWLMRALQIEGYNDINRFKEEKFGETTEILIKKEELLSALFQTITVRLNLAINELDKEFLQKFKPQIEDAGKLIELFTKKEYEFAHHEEKIEIERKLAVEILCLQTAEDQLRLSGVLEAVRKLGGSLGKTQRSQELSNLCQELQVNIRKYPLLVQIENVSPSSLTFNSEKTEISSNYGKIADKLTSSMSVTQGSKTSKESGQQSNEESYSNKPKLTEEQQWKSLQQLSHDYDTPPFSRNPDDRKTIYGLMPAMSPHRNNEKPTDSVPKQVGEQPKGQRKINQLKQKFESNLSGISPAEKKN